jgi:hypothetical protein
MEHLRTRWAALVVALLLLLSVAGVAGAAQVVLPALAAPQAQDQVAEDGDEDADEDTDEDTTEDEDTDEDTDADAQDAPDADGAQGEHGALVSAVAQNKECVGGLHENHGWAVSQVARGLLAPDVVTGCPLWVPPTVTVTTESPDATENLNPAGKPKGKSGEHQKAKTHGRWASEP